METEYTVIRSKRRTLSLEIKGGRVLVRAPQRISERKIREFIEEHSQWIRLHLERQLKTESEKNSVLKLDKEELLRLKAMAKDILTEKVRYYSMLIGVTFGKITIRCQKTRWGSCSCSGNLNFNCLLMLCPERIIDSVVVHELCHRKYMDHSARFYNEVVKYCPDYADSARWLKENGRMIMARLPEDESGQ